MRTDLIKLWLSVALAAVLASATVAGYQTPTGDSAVVTAPGALLFQAKGCSGCHTILGVADFASVGPNLTHLAGVAGERIAALGAAEYVTQSIREPQAFTVTGYGADLMPTLKVSDSEVESLVEFLLTER